MADTNLDNLGNMNALELNTTMLNETKEIPMAIMNIVKDSVGDTWFLVSILGIFIFLNYLFYRREENFGFDIARSLLFSSGFSFLISVSLLLSNWINTIFPIIWFGSLIFISFIIVYGQKKKNQ